MRNCNWYAAVNRYASEIDIGFANTWTVRKFATRHERDDFVKSKSSRGVRAIKSREIRKYAEALGGASVIRNAAGEL